MQPARRAGPFVLEAGSGDEMAELVGALPAGRQRGRLPRQPVREPPSVKQEHAEKKAGGAGLLRGGSPLRGRGGPGAPPGGSEDSLDLAAVAPFPFPAGALATAGAVRAAEKAVLPAFDVKKLLGVERPAVVLFMLVGERALAETCAAAASYQFVVKLPVAQMDREQLCGSARRGQCGCGCTKRQRQRFKKKGVVCGCGAPPVRERGPAPAVLNPEMAMPAAVQAQDQAKEQGVETFPSSGMPAAATAKATCWSGQSKMLSCTNNVIKVRPPPVVRTRQNWGSPGSEVVEDGGEEAGDPLTKCGPPGPSSKGSRAAAPLLAQLDELAASGGVNYKIEAIKLMRAALMADMAREPAGDNLAELSSMGSLQLTLLCEKRGLLFEDSE